MKLATFTESGRTRLGVVEGEEVIDVGSERHSPPDLLTLLTLGAEAMSAVRSARDKARARYPLSAVRLETPVQNPRKFLGLGGSYRSHLEEVAHLGIQAPKHQQWFNKQVTCLIGPYDDIHYPKVSDTLDYEGELAFIIGKRCRHVDPRKAGEVIAGFTICNDVSVREWQLRSPTAMLGKSFDTHGPVGPWLVTSDELPNVHNVSIKTWVNGELRQNGNTGELIYRFGEMLAELTAAFTLEPGDILTTGSPAGVGGAMRPPKYLQVDDVCRIDIEGIGRIENRIVAGPT